LVELLVVIGIIGLLVAILLPVMGGVRRQSRVVACHSNLKQLFTACQTFTTDHNGESSPCPSTTSDVYNGSAATQYVRSICAWGMKSSAIADLDNGAVWKYVGGTAQTHGALLFCPADDPESEQSPATPVPKRNLSYSLSSYMRLPLLPLTQKPTGAIPILMVKKPTERIMIWEEVAPNDGLCQNPAVSTEDRPAGRHGNLGSRQWGAPQYNSVGRGNYCFFDGHVETLSPEQVINGINSNGINGYYCPLLQ
jgi:prepilin-type processing-associated H-X9-DG protein